MGLFLVIGMTLVKYSPTNAQGIAKVNTPYVPELKQSDFKELNIGDKVPDVIFKNLLNYPTSTASLFDFKAKLIILDFWSSSCLSCIKLFPHMQSLQDEFKNDLQIILVNGKTKIYKDTEAKAKGILERLKKNTGSSITLPITMDCEDLDEYFPWETIPHEVWIDGTTGKVLAITGSIEVKSSNIKAILEGKNVPMHIKKDVSFDLQTQSLSELDYKDNFFNEVKPLSSFIFIKGLINGIGSRSGVRQLETSRGTLYTGSYVTNVPLFDIFETAYRIKYPYNQIIIETKEAARFREINYKDTSSYSSVYSYDIIVPPSTMNEILSQIRSNLEGTFHITVKEEKRKMKCLVVKFNARLKNSFSIGGDLNWDSETDLTKVYVENYPANILLKELNRYCPYPIIDEAGIATPINTIISSDLKNVSNIIASLRLIGFDVIEEERLMNAIIICDK